MDARQIIEMALAYRKMTKTELANNLGWSPQLLNKRINTGKLKVEEWEMIGAAMGAKAEIRFIFDNGKII